MREDEKLHEKIKGLEMCKHHCGLFGGRKVETGKKMNCNAGNKLTVVNDF